MTDDYVRTVQLLLSAAPAVFETQAFAMKGGTALNLFVQDMPRLSVDIDVVFRNHEVNRADALAAIGAELQDAKARLGRSAMAATNLPPYSSGVWSTGTVTGQTAPARPLRREVDVREVWAT